MFKRLPASMRCGCRAYLAKTMIGEKISPVLVEIEEALLDSEQSGLPPMYTDDGFRAALKVFMSAMLDRMWMLQGKEAMDFNDRSLMAEKMGGEVRVTRE